MIRVYIAGAISNNSNYKRNFKKAEEKLKKLGVKVFNPCKNADKVEDIEDYKKLINLGLKDLMMCDCIYMLNGYEKSKGATLEKHYAEVVGIKIMYERQ